MMTAIRVERFEAIPDGYEDALKACRKLYPMPADWALPNPHPHGYQFLTNAETIDSYEVPKDKLAAALNGTFKPLDYTDSSPSWAWTAGGATSTAGELATYVKALVGGGLLDAKMQKVRFDSIRPITSGAGFSRR